MSTQDDGVEIAQESTSINPISDLEESHTAFDELEKVPEITSCGQDSQHSQIESKSEGIRKRAVTFQSCAVRGSVMVRRESVRPQKPASVPAIVPELGSAFLARAELKSIREMLISGANILGSPCRGVVVLGIGGSGKSIAAASTVRDVSVRRHFDVIAWATIGQVSLFYDSLKDIRSHGPMVHEYSLRSRRHSHNQHLFIQLQ